MTPSLVLQLPPTGQRHDRRYECGLERVPAWALTWLRSGPDTPLCVPAGVGARENRCCWKNLSRLHQQQSDEWNAQWRCVLCGLSSRGGSLFCKSKSSLRSLHSRPECRQASPSPKLFSSSPKQVIEKTEGFGWDMDTLVVRRETNVMPHSYNSRHLKTLSHLELNQIKRRMNTSRIQRPCAAMSFCARDNRTPLPWTLINKCVFLPSCFFGPIWILTKTLHKNRAQHITFSVA